MKILGVSLRGKVVLAIAVPVFAVSVFIFLYFPGRQADAADVGLQQRADSLAFVLRSLVEPYLDLDNSEGIEEEFNSVSSDRDLRYIAVVKPDGKVFAQHPQTEDDDQRKIEFVTQMQRTISHKGKLLHVAVPIAPGGGNEVTGTLIAGFSRETILDAKSNSQQAALLVSGIILALGVLIAWLMSASIVNPLQDMSDRLTKVAEDLLAAARAREASAAEEAAAVEETRRTMDMLLTSAQKIADSASVVLGNAERTLDGNREIAERISQLNRHAEKVAEILATIMQIADRTDLLALNAALEGTAARRPRAQPA